MILFVEGYVDLALAVFLNLYAMLNSQWESPMNEKLTFQSFDEWKNIWFSTNDMIVNSTLTLLGSLIVVFIPLYILVIVWLNKDKLDTSSVKDKYGQFYEDYHLENWWSRNYTVLSLVRKMVIMSVLIFLPSYRL